MLKYTLQRILYMFIVFMIITLMCFVLIRMLPLAPLPAGDPHTAIVEARREAMGYNKPYLEQFWMFLKNVVTKFDWGVSDKLFLGRDVVDIFTQRLPATVIVNLYSIIFAIPIGIALGVFGRIEEKHLGGLSDFNLDHGGHIGAQLCLRIPDSVYFQL